MAILAKYPLTNTFVSEDYNTENYGTFPTTYTGRGSGSTDTYKMYLGYDISDIPYNATISSAVLKVYVYRKDAAGDLTINITQLDESFIQDTVTYDTGITSSALETGDSSTKVIGDSDVGGFISITVTNTLSSWYATPANAHGFEISGPTTTDDTVIGFSSINNKDTSTFPVLEIEYTVTYDLSVTSTAQTTQTISPTGDGAFSTSYDISKALSLTYIINNANKNEAVIVIQGSSDNVTFYDSSTEYKLAGLSSIILDVPSSLMYVRLKLTGVFGSNTVSITPYIKT